MASYRLRQRGADDAEGTEGIAHVGCPRDGGRLVRFRVANVRRQSFRVRCDRCPDTVHEGAGPGRRLGDGEPEPELVEIPAADTPTPPPPDTPPEPDRAPRRKVSDAQIMAALSPTEDRPAVEVAAALGYDKSSSLLSRIRRMNSAADSVQVEIVGDGRRLALRLPVDTVDSVTESAGSEDAAGGSGAEEGPE